MEVPLTYCAFSKMVSIIIIAFNEKKIISKCLESIRRQSYKNYEVIVYDNASSDGTSEFIKTNYPEIVLIQGDTNLGFGGAINCSARQAKGDYLTFLNSDSEVDENWLEPLIKTLELDSSIGAVGAELVCCENNDIVLSHGTGIHFSGVTYAKDRGTQSLNGEPFETGGLSGGSCLISRNLFLSIGGFEESFFLYFEDTDLSIRLRSMGKKCLIVPSAKIYHNCESRFSYRKIFFLERNRYLSLFSILNMPLLLAMMPSIIIFELISWGYCVLRGWQGVKSKIQAWMYIFNHLSWIHSRRKRIINRNLSYRFMLGAFTPVLKIDYIHPAKVITKITEFIGWISAAPFMALIWLFSK
jgi:GT2 family glycosyltransferase